MGTPLEDIMTTERIYEGVAVEVELLHREGQNGLYRVVASADHTKVKPGHRVILPWREETAAKVKVKFWGRGDAP